MSMMNGVAAARPVSNLNRRIAARVRGLRTEQDLTLDALALQCGVSRSMLSLIERGESSPTAVVLEKVARGLGVALAALFDDPAAPPSPLARRADHTPWRDPGTSYIRRTISPENYPSPIRIVEVVLPAKTRVAYESGSREVPMAQQVWVQEGILDVAVGTIAYRLVPDDCLAMPLNVPISFHNRTRNLVRYIVVVGNVGTRGFFQTTDKHSVRSSSSE
jgi:transcriptional regulator with XRE-family HTH domain